MDSVHHFRGIRAIFLSALFFFISFAVKAQLWSEDFTGEANGATTGTAGGTLGGTWSSSYSGSGTSAKANLPLVGEGYHISGTTSQAVWSTNTINIASVGYAIINVDVFSAFVDGNDYLRIAYVLDGVEVIFYELIGGNPLVDFEPATPASAIVAGSSLQVKVYSRNDPGFIQFFNDQYAFDNVTITAAPVIYSRTSGSWTNAVAGTGTWSLTGHTGASCACYPLNTQVAIIGAGHTVTLQSSQTTVGTTPTTNLAPGAVDVYGTLQYSTNNNVTLGIQQGLFRVRSGGVVNSNPGTLTGEAISFQADVGGATFQVDAGGTAAIEDLVLGAAAANLHYLTGGGTLSITDDILIDASGATLTNNRSASFTVSGDVDFNGANSAFVNNASMTISGDILMDADNSSFTNNASSLTITDDLNFNSINSAFTNNATASIGDIVATGANDDDNVVTNSSGATLNLGGINPALADMDIFNSGTINQSGNFSNISNADTNFDNLATGIWNWTLTPNTPLDVDMSTVLDCTAAGNIFNYSGTGAQSIIPATYYHLTLSNSGDKLTSAVLDVNGNLLLQNTAVLSSAANAIDVEGNIDIQNTAVLGNGTSTGNINIGGNWSAVNAASFVQGSRTVTFDGSVAQSITNPSGEIFNNLTINNLTPTSPLLTLFGNVTVSSVLTMTRGNVNLNGNTMTLSSSAAGALGHSLASTAGWMYGGSFARARPATTTISVNSVDSFFPLGSASDWRPFFAGQNNATTAGTMTVTHTNSTSTSTVSISDNNPMPAVTIIKRHNSFWTPRTTATNGSYNLRAGGTNFGTITNSGHLQMATSTGAIVGARAAGSGGPDWRVNRTALTTAELNANNFHVASTNAASPLPIELLAFTALLKNNVVELKWSTASETNNDHFTIERAIDIEDFQAILTHDGKGTTKELNHYSLVDSSPLYGRSYYRLKQTDFDGKFTYSELKTIDYDGPDFATLTAYPNPVTDPTLKIKIEGLKEAGDVRLQILNMHGQKVFEKIIEIKTPGIITEEISRTTFPSPGLYIIKAGETLYLTRKIVIE